MAKMMFFSFLNFFLFFFLEFSNCCLVGMEFRTIFFFSFFGLYQPSLDRNISGMMFFNFLNFFAIFFGIF